MANPLQSFLQAVRADYATVQRYRAKYHGDERPLARLPADAVTKIGFQMMIAMRAMALFRDAGETRAFAPGETIFVEGEEGRQMFVVLEGSVRLSVTGRTLEKVGKGGVFGEMALIDAAPRSATATALTACTLAPVAADRFRSLVRENPDFALEIMQVMAARLRSMDRRL